MPQTKNPQEKKTMLIFLAVALCVVGFVAVLFYQISGNESITPFAPMITTKKTAEVGDVPRLRTRSSVFKKIDQMYLYSHVELPVQSGEKGKDNPFEKIERFKSTEDEIISDTSPEDEDGISQGSK